MLSKIQETIYLIKYVKSANKNNNRIGEIPSEVSNLVSLTYFSLSGNLLDVELDTICKEGVSSLFKYLQEKLTKLYEAKLVFVGEGAGAKIAIDGNSKNLEEAADLFKELGTGSVEAARKIGEQFFAGDDIDLIPDDSLRNRFAHGNPLAPEAAILREIQQLLKAKDIGFGGLVRVQNKRGEFLWVHPDYKQEYSPDLPIVPEPYW